VILQDLDAVTNRTADMRIGRFAVIDSFPFAVIFASVETRPTAARKKPGTSR
jgi:hypothetical protein